MAARQDHRLRVLELFAGIGGCAAVLGDTAHVVAAIDIHADALAVYRGNFPHRTICRTLESFPAKELAAFHADLWWLSPPCQPYTRKGKQRDVDDPRAAALVHLIDGLAHVRPQHVVLENVPPFAESQSRARLIGVLEASGYRVHERIVCPSELGIPNRRRRYYVLASQVKIEPIIAADRAAVPLSNFIDRAHDDDPQFALDPAVAEQYLAAIDVVEADDPHAVTSCFTSAYGRSVVRSGSYLRTPRGLRRFAPSEVAALLGFPREFAWPADFSHQQKWRLLGNSLSLWAVREVLAPILSPWLGGMLSSS
jgi:site-specific DNA-cytosine methylase